MMQPLFDFYAERAGCGASGSVEAVLACLRAAPIGALARAQDAGGELCVFTLNVEFVTLTFTGLLSAAYSRGSSYKRWAPVLDRKIIADYPTKLLAEGKFARVPIIIG